ncbi:hypothetical protein [Longimicrobium sp.]|uniref:hypothetical protein n=1 Tax=Longimicrobium sp. TaxID=2029185 RepID=UPI003B3A1AE3
MDQPRSFAGIWYRSKPVTESTQADPFVRERGSLAVTGDTITFQGPRTQVVMRGVEAVEYGVHGSMNNPSVHVRYREDGEPRSAWLTDGGMGGYAGMFGGTRRLADALSHLAPTTFDDTGASRVQRRLAWLLVGVVLVFIVRAFRARYT